jgi:catechol 2,3-dioxygenase-like lactoylglutathione lyase family enzyme
MHQSRLSNIVIDCQLDDLAPAIEFWSRALGKPIADADEDGDGKYAKLQTADDEPVILLQKVEHPSRVHLDIETDDLDAEVQRLETLGARRIELVHERWWVMQAPSGHRFCVVQRQEGQAIKPHANRWD